MYRHFKAIAEAVDLPMILYNVPGRTVADCSTTRCCAWRRCRASSASRKRPATSSAPHWLIRDAPKGFAIYSRRRPDRRRADAVRRPRQVSVTANVAPRLMHELCAAALAGDAKSGDARSSCSLMPLHQNLFVEPNPIPVKWAMARHGPAAAPRCACR